MRPVVTTEQPVSQPVGATPGAQGGRDGDEPNGGRLWSRFPWRRVLAVLGVVVLLILLAPAAVVNPIARRVVSGYGGDCAELSGVRVDSGSWPVVLRAVTGRLSDVSVEIDEIRFDTFSIYDVSSSASSIRVRPLGLAAAGGDAKVQGGETSSTLLFADIERIYAEYDVTLTLRRDDLDPSRLIADVDVPLLGPIPTGVTITPAEGDLELVLAPLDMFELPPIRITSAEPFEASSVDIGDEAVRIESTFEGTLGDDDFACDVATD
jgi:hypothetical protein